MVMGSGSQLPLQARDSEREREMASGGIKSFYRQKKKGGVAKPSRKGSGIGKSASAAALALSATDPEQFPIHGADAEQHGKAGLAAAFEEEEVERLRQFDLDMRYGPCVGLSRMERWDRAAAMGLSPPADVEAILLKSAAAAAADCLWVGRI